MPTHTRDKNAFLTKVIQKARLFDEVKRYVDFLTHTTDLEKKQEYIDAIQKIVNKHSD